MNQSPKERMQNHSLVLGIGIIVLGMVFLLMNMGVVDLGHRWWALFFLIPISFLLTDVLRRRKASEQTLPGEARGSLIGLVILIVLMFIFLLDLNWGMIWPVFIIIAGLSLILSGWR